MYTLCLFVVTSNPGENYSWTTIPSPPLRLMCVYTRGKVVALVYNGHFAVAVVVDDTDKIAPPRSRAALIDPAD